MTRATCAAVLALVAGSAVLVAGCGSKEDVPAPAAVHPEAAPSDAPVQMFCAAYGGGPGQAPDGLRVSAGKLAAVGTPRDIPMPARAGFVVYVSDAANGAAPQAGSGDATAYAAFVRYAAGTCFTPAG